MKKTVFIGLLVIVLAFGFIGCGNDNEDGDDITRTLDVLLTIASVEVVTWGDGSEEDPFKKYRLYSFNPAIKDELIQAVLNAGFIQIDYHERTDMDIFEHGFLRWCVSFDPDIEGGFILFGAVGGTTEYKYIFS